VQYSAIGLKFRASFVFVIYKWYPIKHPRDKISLICRWHRWFVVDKNKDAVQQKMLCCERNRDMVSKKWCHYKYWKNSNSVFHSNQLTLPNKTRVVFNDTEIALKAEVGFLGIYITENLKWNVYVHSLCSSLSEVSYIIKLLQAVLSPYVLRSIYFVYFQSFLRYEIIFWNLDSESKTAFKVQK